MKTLLYVAAGMAMAAALTACGGGGGGGGAAVALPTSDAPGVADNPAQNPGKSDAPMALAPACTGCGAADQTTYAGSGTGIWQATNASTVPTDFPVYLKGLTGQMVTLVFTNESSDAVAMPSVRIDSSHYSSQLSKLGADVPADDAWAKAKADIAEFNAKGFGKYVAARASKALNAQKTVLPGAPAEIVAGYVLGDQRSIYLSGGSQRTVQLAGIKTTGDGKTVNVWVETSERSPSKVSDLMVDRIRDAFAGQAGIYDQLVTVGGPLWGPHNEPDLISGTGQPIDIFFVNFDRNNQPYGLGGYFWALNNFKTSTPGALFAQSNESVSMYMDTETLYLDGERGFLAILSSLGHEGTHMQNFYRRGVQMGAEFAYDVWLEEMTAMMMEDWVSASLNPTYNAMRDMRFPTYLSYGGQGSYNCSLTNWQPMGASCESYSVNGSFGAYLNRQFGLAFFKSLLNSTGVEDSEDILNAAIKAQRPGSSIGTEVRHFTAASAGLVPLGSGGAEYSMPARSDEGFSLVAIDPASFGLYMRGMPSSVPAMLQPLASFPVSRYSVKGSYEETVRVPPGTTLTVVVN